MVAAVSINHDSMGITDKQHDNMKHKQHHQQQINIIVKNSNQYTVNLHFDPIVLEAGRKTVLTISVTEDSGTPVRDFELVHDKFMHLIIVGEDLAYFAHIHPTLAGNDGNFTINHMFSES